MSSPVANNKRSSMLLSSLAAIDTSFTSPAMTTSPSVFSSATISSMASSVSPSKTDLKHPLPRRYEAQNSPLLMKSETHRPVPSKLRSPPPRPLSPVSPNVAKNASSFLNTEVTPTSEYQDSPLSATSEYYCLQEATPLRQQWSNTLDAPTPPPQKGCPMLPPSAAQRSAIRLWESRITRRTPAPPSPIVQQIPVMHHMQPRRAPPPPPVVVNAASQFDHNTSNLIMSPAEQDIQELSFQIKELHHYMARSDGMFKQGMMSVYMQQNAAAQRIAAIHSPSDDCFPEFLHRPSSTDSESSELSSTEGFLRRNREQKRRSVEIHVRAMKVAQEMEQRRMECIKISLMDRLEREVNQIESRALRDLEMVREARYALHMEVEREKARERRRLLEEELAEERQRQAAEDARKEEEEAFASLEAAAADAFVVAFSPVGPPPEYREREEEDEAEGESEIPISADIFFRPPSATSSPSLTSSLSTVPSTTCSRPVLALDCSAPVLGQLPLQTSAPNTAGTLKSPLLTFLASPISPCSPAQVVIAFENARASLESNGFMGLGFHFELPSDEVVTGSGMNGAVALCA